MDLGQYAIFPTCDGDMDGDVYGASTAVEEPGSGKSPANNLPTPAYLTESHYAKKILFLKLQFKNRSRWFEDRNIFNLNCNRI